MRNLSLEGWVWMAGLVYLACIDPFATGHLEICPMKRLGFDFCPGCGLGRSISFLLHGHVVRSLQTHPLGIAAFGILLFRITTLFRNTQKRVRRHRLTAEPR